MTTIKGPGQPNPLQNQLPVVNEKPLVPTTTISGEVALSNAEAGRAAVEQLGARVRAGADSTVSLAGPMNDPFVGQVSTGFISGIFDASSMTMVAPPLLNGVPDPNAVELPLLSADVPEEAKRTEVGKTYKAAVADHYDKLTERWAPQVGNAIRVINDPLFSTPGSPGNVALNAAQVAVGQAIQAQAGGGRLQSQGPGNIAANLDTVNAAGRTVVEMLKGTPGTAFSGIDFNNMDINDAITLMMFMLAKDATLDLKDLLKDMNTTRLKRAALRDGITKLKGWLATEKDKARNWFNANASKFKPGTTFEDYFKSLKLQMPSVTFDYKTGSASVHGGGSVNPTSYDPSLEVGPSSETGPTNPPEDPPGNSGLPPTDETAGASDTRMVSGGGSGGGGGGVGAVSSGGGVSSSGGVSSVGGGGGGGMSVGGGGGGGGISGVSGGGGVSASTRSTGVSGVGASGGAGATDNSAGPAQRMGSEADQMETMTLSGESAESFEANLSKFSDMKDSLADMGEEQQLKMQMYMDRMQKANSMASNLMKKNSEISSQIIGNFK